MRKEEKTNVMRLLDVAGVPYQARYYDDSLTDGALVADAVGMPREVTFKTLVTVGASGGHFVFVIPVNCSLDLKKAARAAHEKNIAMIPQRELLPLTGYVHGGCSPIGMKKPFPTFFDETAQLFDTVCFSGGRRGTQVEVEPMAAAKMIHGSFADVTENG